MSVHGRVSDIWRSYFAQALFPRINASVAFLKRPIVVQDRNPHSYEADFNAEIPLYSQSHILISYLMDNYVRSTNIKAQTFIEIIEELFIDMYERGFIEVQDVFNIQEWIEALLKLGYQFNSIQDPYRLERKKSLKNISLKYSNDSIFLERTKFCKLGININVRREDSYLKINLCSPFKYNLTFGSSDRHDGPIIDIPSTLLSMGQDFVQLGPELWKSHPQVFSKTGRNFKDNYPDITNMTAMHFTQNNISPPLLKYIDHSTKLDPDWPHQNLEFYRNDPLVMNIDAFICTFPASICQIWAPFNKSIIFLPAHR